MEIEILDPLFVVLRQLIMSTLTVVLNYALFFFIIHNYWQFNESLQLLLINFEHVKNYFH